MWQFLGSPQNLSSATEEASLETCQQLGLLLPHTCTEASYGFSPGDKALDIFSSAEVSCVCLLEPRSSGVCRSNDTITATGILTPRVEIRHFLMSAKVGQQKKKKSLEFTSPRRVNRL